MAAKSGLAPEVEAQRLGCLEGYGILDTPAESVFDDLSRLAARLCDTPVALINFVDAERQWTKSQLGWALQDVPRQNSFCAEAITLKQPLVVSDLAKDKRFAENPFVKGPPNMRFYAGAQLISPE